MKIHSKKTKNRNQNATVVAFVECYCVLYFSCSLQVIFNCHIFHNNITILGLTNEEPVTVPVKFQNARCSQSPMATLLLRCFSTPSESSSLHCAGMGRKPLSQLACGLHTTLREILRTEHYSWPPTASVVFWLSDMNAMCTQWKTHLELWPSGL